MRGTINIQGIDCYAYHGCLEEEAKIGQDYSVDVKLQLDLAPAIATDDLNSTIDYVIIHKIVKQEMAVRSKLIEQVAGRILISIKNRFPDLKYIAVTAHKFNPPVNGFFDKASVTVEESFP